MALSLWRLSLPTFLVCTYQAKVFFRILKRNLLAVVAKNYPSGVIIQDRDEGKSSYVTEVVCFDLRLHNMKIFINLTAGL